MSPFGFGKKKDKYDLVASAVDSSDLVDFDDHISGTEVQKILFNLIPGLAGTFTALPCGCQVYDERGKAYRWQLALAIVHLNDTRHMMPSEDPMGFPDCRTWTREEIACWLETLDADLRIRIPEETEER